MKKEIEKYYNEDKTAIAVLISSGYGAGWSTWNEKELAWDKRVVEFWLKYKDNFDFMELIDCPNNNQVKYQVKKFFESLGYDDVYFGGFQDIQMFWVPVGTLFCVKENDGFEYVETSNDLIWEVA